MPASKDVILDKHSSPLKPDPVYAKSPQRILKKKRSKGVAIFAWLHRILGILGLILIAATIRMLLSPNTLRVIRYRFENRFYPLSFSPWFFVLIAVIGVFSVLYLMIGSGLLKLKEWSRKWAIYLSVFGIFFNLIYSVKCFSRDLRPTGWIGNFILAFIIIYFFTRPKVKEQFR
ncbi:MAG: hypothetical protein PVI33_03450 [Candidatus Omnitrophota bacterium]|jgi:hypothetical protein